MSGRDLAGRVAGWRSGIWRGFSASSRPPGARESCAVLMSGQARRNIRENLPLEVALAAMETIDGSITVNPYRAGNALDEPSDGYDSAA